MQALRTVVTIQVNSNKFVGLTARHSIQIKQNHCLLITTRVLQERQMGT